MNGYILYRQPDGSIARVEEQRSSRASLKKILEESVPPGLPVLGIVFGPKEQSRLQVLRAAS